MENKKEKKIHVVAAIIVSGMGSDCPKFFATQRGYGQYKDWWEFPGGKLEPGESAEVALIREIKEELDADIKVGEFLTKIEYDYPTFHLSMDCFICELENDHLALLEHEAAKWLSIRDIDSVDWLPADIEVVDALRKAYTE